MKMMYIVTGGGNKQGEHFYINPDHIKKMKQATHTTYHIEMIDGEKFTRVQSFEIKEVNTLKSGRIK